MDEIRILLQFSDDLKLSCVEADQIARHHLDEIRQRVLELTEMPRQRQDTI
nr:MerR family DNA-binding protein [Ahniella affigens]